MADLAQIAAERAEAELFPQAELAGLPRLPASRAEDVARRRAGRPPGARNKRAEDIARAIIERLGDPLLHQAAIATMDVDELAARLGCTALEAQVEKRLAAAVVLPYVHQRKPVAVDVSTHRIVQLSILGSDGEPKADPWAHLDEAQENQQVIDGEANDV